jgi:hypothetical protein
LCAFARLCSGVCLSYGLAVCVHRVRRLYSVVATGVGAMCVRLPQAPLRSIWEKYYESAHGVVFVVDATDEGRFIEARNVLGVCARGREAARSDSRYASALFPRARAWREVSLSLCTECPGPFACGAK